VRAARWLDLGLELQVVYGRFDLTSVSYTDLGSSLCPNQEYQPCDSTTHLLTDGATATAAGGLMIRPASWISFGLHVRGPYTLSTSGKVTATPPRAAPITIKPEPVRFTTQLPWVVRFGLRFVYVRQAFERADLELDATYENWAAAQGDGPKVDIPELGLFQNIHTTVVHHYHDTFSIRLGAAYNIPIHDAVLSVRAGAFYDSSATDNRDTRLDFDTLAKWAGTAGLGVRTHGVKLDLAYAFMYEPERLVSDGRLTPTTPTAPSQPLGPINNGRYHGRTQVVSIGVQITWDELLKKQRTVAYGADWERASPQAPPPAPEPETPTQEP
jgi:long-subunit fatty acid transport protein